MTDTDTNTHSTKGSIKNQLNSQVKLCSVNIQGLNTPKKRSQLLYSLQKSKTHIAFIQETHFRSDNIPKLGNRHYPTVFHASNVTSKTKGVTILISKACPLQISEIKQDANGRYIFLKGTLYNKPITLANLYAPNKQQVSFFRETLQLLTEFYSGILIVGGDFNAALTPTQDSSTGSSSMPYIALRAIKKLEILHFTHHPTTNILELTSSITPRMI